MEADKTPRKARSHLCPPEEDFIEALRLQHPTAAGAIEALRLQRASQVDHPAQPDPEEMAHEDLMGLAMALGDTAARRPEFHIALRTLADGFGLKLEFEQFRLSAALTDDRVKPTREQLFTAIRKVRDQRGDDRCWLDLDELYRLLPEGKAGADTALPPPDEMLGNCKRFIAHCHDPALPYVSPQRRIDELEAEVHRLKAKCAMLAGYTQHHDRCRAGRLQNENRHDPHMTVTRKEPLCSCGLLETYSDVNVWLQLREPTPQLLGLLDIGLALFGVLSMQGETSEYVARVEDFLERASTTVKTIRGVKEPTDDRH